MKKWISAWMLTIALGAACLPAYADGLVADWRYRVDLGSGVKLSKLHSFYEWGSQSLSLLEIDLKAKGARLDALYNPEGFSKRQTLSGLTGQDPSLIGAVNGDFFSLSSPSFSLGTLVKDGKPLSNAHWDPNKFAALIAGQNRHVIDYISPLVYVENKTRGKEFYLSALNKPSPKYQNPVAYTREYVRATPGKAGAKDMVEIVIQQDKVRQIRVGQPGIAIPADATVLLAAGFNGQAMKNSFSVGDQVALHSAVKMRYPDVVTAIGGGTMLLKDGKPTPLTQTVSGKSQRTAVGITGDQKLLILVNDGRQWPYLGMNEKDVRAYFQSVGVKDAMMLDGGGSSQMIADGKTQNVLSSGQRPLVNGLGIRPTQKPGPIARIELTLLTERLYANRPAEVAIRGFDAKGAALPLTTAQFKVGFEALSGAFDGRSVIFKNGGKGALTASYNGIIGRLPVEVTARYMTDTRKIQAPGTAPLAVLYPDMKDPAPPALPAVPEPGTDPLFVPQEPALKEKSPLFVDPAEPAAQAPKEPLPAPPALPMEYSVRQSMQALLDKSPHSIGFFSTDPSFDSALSSPKTAIQKGQQSQQIGAVRFVSIDNRGAGIFSKGGQWDFLKKQLSEAKGPVVLLLHGTDASKDSRDQRAFEDFLHRIGDQKDLLVIYHDDTYQARQDGRVSFLGIPDFEDAKRLGNLGGLKAVGIYEKAGKLQYALLDLPTP